MKHAILKKAGAAFLIIGLAFALPAYAEKHGGADAMGMGEKGGPDAQQMSGMMRDMSGEMMGMSDMMARGNMDPETMKKMSDQMKQMGDKMKNMSGMMGKGTMKDPGMQKQMDQMRKDMPAAPAKE